MSVSQNTENEQQNNLCTTLTEQWKKGELEDGFYYFRMPDGTTDIASEYKLIRYILVRDADKIEVLAPVPSYEEWKAAYECQLMESELVLTLKELLLECKANLIHKKQLLEKLDKLEKPTKELLTKITNAIGEKK